MVSIYNIPQHVSGVYKITNNVTGEFYVGASKIKDVCDGNRPSAFGYKWKYKD